LSIKSLNHLTEEIIKQVRKVEQSCKSYDGLNGSMTLDSSINFDPQMKNLYLFYEEDLLVSVLALFMPTSEAAEISAYTLPEFRRKGYFKQLLNEATKELQKYQVSNLLFVCEPQSKDGMETIKKIGVELDFTEYLLQYNHSAKAFDHVKSTQIELKKATLDDLETMVKLSQLSFDDEYEDAKSMITKAFESESRTQYIAILNEQPIGLGGVYLEDGEVSLFGLGISPNFQGKGFGKELLHLIIEELKHQGIQNITLEVDSNNQTAFQLYRKYGFEIQAAFDYYRKSLI
jgi:ribosomal protein S18 acetylase RimI-like enzyme